MTSIPADLPLAGAGLVLMQRPRTLHDCGEGYCVTCRLDREEAERAYGQYIAALRADARRWPTLRRHAIDRFLAANDAEIELARNFMHGEEHDAWPVPHGEDIEALTDTDRDDLA